MSRKEKSVHQIINRIRKKRGLPYAKWSNKMAYFAKSQARYCAKMGKLIHSNRPALKGGENLCGGTGNMSSRSIVKCWMTSNAGHREWLLDPRVRFAGVGIAKSKHGTYAAWAFSDQPFTMDTLFSNSKLKIPFHLKFPFLTKHNNKGVRGVLRLPVKIIMLCASILSIVLGIHGLWVYFSPLEVLFGNNSSKLFLGISLPQRLKPMIEWMSMKGFHSWVIPAAFIVLGIVLWGWQSNIHVGDKFGWLRKLHLW
jgi:hypothetical protein